MAACQRYDDQLLENKNRLNHKRPNDMVLSHIIGVGDNITNTNTNQESFSVQNAYGFLVIVFRSQLSDSGQGNKHLATVTTQYTGS